MFITVDGFNKTGIRNTLWELVEPYSRIDSAKGVALLAVVILILSNVASNVPTGNLFELVLSGYSFEILLNQARANHCSPISVVWESK